MMPQTPPRARRAILALGAIGLAGTTAVAGAATDSQTPAPQAPAVAATTADAKPAPRSKSRVTISKRRLNVQVGRTAWVRGRVHAHAPDFVRLQRRGDKGWKTLSRDRPDAQGRFLLRYRPGRSGSQRVRVRYSGDKRNRRATAGVGRLNAFRQVQASWYGPGFYGNRTACGSTFSANVLGVAHKTLPCGTRLTLRKGSRTVRVSVIDRGPYSGSREFDLSPAVKQRLGFGSTGVVGTTA